MTEEELQKIKEHIEIHTRRESRARKITQILWKAVKELEATKELQNRLDNQQISIKSYQQDLRTASKIIEQFLSLKNAANKRNEALKILDVREEAKQFLSKIRSM